MHQTDSQGREKGKVENAELPLAYRLRRVYGSHWLTECRAPIGLQIAGSAGIPLAQKNAGSAGLLLAQRMRKVQGAH